jgi:hypothetical protein
MSAAELINPVDGEVIQTNLDSLVSALRNVDEQLQALHAFRNTIARLIAEQAEPPSDTLFQRTARLTTSTGQVGVRLDFPPPRFDQATLRRCWQDWPQFAPQYLAINGLRVKLREYKKLVGMSGNKVFKAFKAGLLSARLIGEISAPRVIVEDRQTKNGFRPDDLDFHQQADDADHPF